MYHTNSIKKASICERFNKSLRQLIYKNFGYIGKYDWVHHLEDILKFYNARKHRTIGMAPNAVNKRNEKHILLHAYNNNIKIKDKSPFEVGNFVRISDVDKSKFRRGFHPSWTTEIYKIVEKQNTWPVTYKIVDSSNSLLQQSFYKEQLQKVKYKDAYLVEKILRKQGDKYLVRWLGFDKSYDSYVPANEIY